MTKLFIKFQYNLKNTGFFAIWLWSWYSFGFSTFHARKRKGTLGHVFTCLS